MVRQLPLTVIAALLVLAGSISASARGGMPPEYRWNPQHIDQLPAEVRKAISPYARICGGPLAAEHLFALYYRSGNANLIGLHFERLRCGNRDAVCKPSGCLHKVYVSTGGPYRLLSSSYVPELDLTQVKIGPQR